MSLSIVAAVLCLFLQPAMQPIEPKPVDLPAFPVIGFAARTTNNAEMSGNGKIGPLWASFGQNAQQIPGVIHSDITFSIYTNYETDETGPYDVILGREVRDATYVPEGMRAIQVPAAHYLMFGVADPSPQGIGAAWGSVYEYFANHKTPERTYGIDFDRHAEDGVAIYVSVR